MSAPIRVLLIEDNPGDARLIREWLRSSDVPIYRVEQVDRLSAGLERLQESGEFDAVLLDLGLPDSQGMAGLRRVVDQAPRTAVLVLTGVEDEQAGLDAVKEGAQDYLPKGQMNGPALVRVIRYAVERSRIEEALRESESRLSEAQAIAHLGYYVFDIGHGRWQSSHILDDIFGIDGSYHRSVSDWLSIVHPEDREMMAAYLETEVLGARQPFNKEYRIARIADGEMRWVHGLGRLDLDDAGVPVRMVGAIQDITDRKRAEQEAREREAIESASRAKTEFMSRMSHELRTPLNSILGFAQLIQMSDPSPDTRDSVRQILAAGRLLLVLVDELLDIGRIEEGRLGLSIEAVALGEPLRQVLELVQPLAQARDIKLSLKGAADDLYVMADAQRLGQVLLNLLSNAVKYNRQGGEVTVECRGGREGWVRVGVTDTGPGIAPDDVGRLFQPFERGAWESSSSEQGTGLGLSISQRLVDAMGGTMGVESEVGVGSTFWVELPWADESMAKAAVREPADGAVETPLSAGSRTVLYVEDNPANVRLMRAFLELRTDIELSTAPTGESALELVQQDRPQLILLDLHLPGMSGWEVLGELQAEPETRAIPVMIITADASQATTERSLEAGALACITKPLNLARLMEVIDSALPRD